MAREMTPHFLSTNEGLVVGISIGIVVVMLVIAFLVLTGRWSK